MLCSNLMWSYGKLGHTHEGLMQALDLRTLQLLPNLQPQSVVREHAAYVSLVCDALAMAASSGDELEV